MRKHETEKPRVTRSSTMEDVGARVVGAGAGFSIGAAHVVFSLDATPGARVTLCVDEGRTVGVVLSGEISTRALHRIPLRTVERFGLAYLRHWAAENRTPAYLESISLEVGKPQEGIAAELEPMTQALEKATRLVEAPGGSRERHLAGLAARYVILCGETGSPTKALATERIMSAATVRDQLARARDKGLLTKPGSGRAGGELTPKAKALLAADEEA